MATTYVDSGLGWIADERFFRYDQGLLCTILGLDYLSESDGSIIYATVYLPTIGSTGPIVMSTEEGLVKYTDGTYNVSAQGSLDYISKIWYISAFAGWQYGDLKDTSDVSQKLTIKASSLYDIGIAVLVAAGVAPKPRNPELKKNFTISYTGESKVIKRLCERVNAVPLIGVEHDEAYFGDWGEEAYQHSLTTSGNPHNVTLSDLGIENLPRRLLMALEAIGAIDSWIDHEKDGTDHIYFTDHEGDMLVFRAASNLLAWH